jgi:hypothetical protein
MTVINLESSKKMGNIEDVRLVSGVWYRLTFPLGKVFEACCIIEEVKEGIVTIFEFTDESRKEAKNILPYLVDLCPIEPPDEGLFRIGDFLDDLEQE